jgi:putative heme-binding domain-containing protein
MKPSLPAAVVLLALASPAPAAGPEPWADPKLPVKDGLELWLDASRVDAAARATKGKPPAPAGKLAVWPDGSGRGRHLRQPADDARPTFLKVGDAGLVRFDGVDDHLRVAGRPGEVRGFTLFLVLAPRANGGDWRGFIGTNAAGGRDYETGLTVGFGPAGAPRMTDLNVEGRGFGGYRNLLKTPGPFGKLHTVEVRGGEKAVRAFVDGAPSGERPRGAGPVSLEEITVGARFPMAGNEQPTARGPVRADFAEVLLYGRELSDAEAKQVRDYLSAKYARLRDDLPPDGDGRAEALVSVPDPPPVQVFAPGFEVRRLPVELPNINNVQYRPDGTLVALGYNGDLWLLKDTDGDGVEDQATLFWEAKGRLRAPIGMDLTPPGYKHGDGAFVASKGKVSLIVDKDGDGKADEEILVASGWKEIVNNVDALAVAIDPKDGAVYYGRGATDFTNPYQVDKDGQARYSTKVQEGVIVRVAPDFKSRETVATGIRYPIALRFNRHGDLFATDQEGATWLANGNPLDELLHVQKGRHYGFPPRHPKHLPDVIDEPSTFDYGPQHQSTCGMHFNDGPRPFGPKEWAGDAIVTGYSRGKLYRTKLVKTPAGYVGRTQLLGSLPMLTIDACPSPDGALVIACHGGGPDWGTGPTGKGALFKVRYVDRDHPQPVFAWPAGPREVRVEFDRPVDPALLRDVLKGTKLTAGKYVRAGDRFEAIWPGYAVVQMEKATPRYDVPVRSAQLTPDRRTLVLATDPLGAAVHYALTLPGMGRPAKGAGPKGALPQYPAIDLDFDLSGCEATWTPKDGGPGWTGWLPHLDLQVARELTAGSASHDALWKAMEKPGELVLKAQLNLTDMLRPAVQPGSKIDYELPAEAVSLEFESAAVLRVNVGGAVAVHNPEPDKKAWFIRTPSHKRGEPVPIEITLTRTDRPVTLQVAYSTEEDKRPRPLQLHRVLLPWADTRPAAVGQAVAAVKVPELEGGSWARGRKVFFAEPANCSKCHSVHGQGGAIGPDLSNLVHRDYASVMRDITQPSFAINPDHVTQTVNLKDGRTLSGVVRTAAGNKITVGDVKGTITEIDRADVEEVKSSSVSTMPDDLVKQLGPARTRDLLTFLLTPPPSMPRDYPGPRPKPRAAAEVNAVLAGAPTPPEKTRPIRVVLVAGPKDHGPGEHDYPAWQAAWKELLAAADNTEVATAWEWPGKDEWGKADVMVFFQRGDWNDKRAADVDAFLERGGGLVYIHWAVDGRKEALGFAKRIGLAAHGGAVGFRHGPIELIFNKDAEHPVARNLDKLAMVDETYWKMVGDLPAGRVIATAVEEKAPRPQLWSLEHGKGRVFVSIPGHYSWTFDDPVFRAVLLRGIAWSAREPVDRFNDLVWPGADVATSDSASGGREPPARRILRQHLDQPADVVGPEPADQPADGLQVLQPDRPAAGPGPRRPAPPPAGPGRPAEPPPLHARLVVRDDDPGQLLPVLLPDVRLDRLRLGVGPEGGQGVPHHVRLGDPAVLALRPRHHVPRCYHMV